MTTVCFLELLEKLCTVKHQETLLTEARPCPGGKDIEVSAVAPEGARAAAYYDSSGPILQSPDDGVQGSEKCVRESVRVGMPKVIEIDHEHD